MDLKDLLVILDAGSNCNGRLDLGAAVAKRHTAALTAYCLYREPAVTTAESYAAGRDATRAVLAHRDARVALAVAPVAARFHEIVDVNAVEGSWTLPTFDQSPQDLALRARAFDLVIVDRDAKSHALAEQIVLIGGTPCLTVGEGQPSPASFDRVVVAWDGSRPSKRALQDGLPFLKQAKAVRMVTVGRENDDLPPHLGQLEMLRHLSRHGIEAAFERVEAGDLDIGAALLREAKLFHADLLVLGAYGHAPMAEALFGGVTRTVLARAPLPVLISH